jgi:hypothetical protein
MALAKGLSSLAMAIAPSMLKAACPAVPAALMQAAVGWVMLAIRAEVRHFQHNQGVASLLA